MLYVFHMFFVNGEFILNSVFKQLLDVRHMSDREADRLLQRCLDILTTLQVSSLRNLTWFKTTQLGSI